MGKSIDAVAGPVRKRTLLTWIYLVAVIAALLIFLHQHYRAFIQAFGALTFPVLIISFVFVVCGILLQSVTWKYIQTRVEKGNRLSAGQWVHAYLFGYLGRYVPGKVGLVVGRILVLSKYGYSSTGVVYAAIIENAMFFVVAGVLGIAFVFPLWSGLPSTQGMILEQVLLGTAILGLILFSPALEKGVAYVAGKFRIGSGDEINCMSLSEKLLALSSSLFYQLVNGAGFVVILSSISGENLSVFESLQAAGTLSLGVAAGILVIVAPVGLGVREAVIVIGLGRSVTPETALAGALAIRAVMMCAELALYLAAEMFCHKFPPSDGSQSESISRR